MAISDYTDVVAWFSDEAAAEIFAKFVASEGMPCHITGMRNTTDFEQFGVRVQRNRIDELREILRLRPVANGVTHIAAQSMGRRLARAGIPCCVAGEHSYATAAFATALCETREFGHVVAVPEAFLGDAVRLLNITPPTSAVLTELALLTRPDSTRPH
jgi:hypothetical protein